MESGRGAGSPTTRRHEAAEWARAIVRNPQLFPFDEPLSSFDAKLQVQMHTVIKALQKRLGTTSAHVTHGQVEAMTKADRSTGGRRRPSHARAKGTSR